MTIKGNWEHRHLHLDKWLKAPSHLVADNQANLLLYSNLLDHRSRPKLWTPLSHRFAQCQGIPISEHAGKIWKTNKKKTHMNNDPKCLFPNLSCRVGSEQLHCIRLWIFTAKGANHIGRVKLHRVDKGSTLVRCAVSNDISWNFHSIHHRFNRWISKCPFPPESLQHSVYQHAISKPEDPELQEPGYEKLWDSLPYLNRTNLCKFHQIWWIDMDPSWSLHR